MSRNIDADAVRPHRYPSRSGETILRGMNGVAGTLAGEVGNKKVYFGPPGRILIVAKQKVTRPQDVPYLLADGYIHGCPPSQGARKRYQRLARRNDFRAAPRVQQQRRAPQQQCRHPEAPPRPHAEASPFPRKLGPLKKFSARCRAKSINSDTTKISHPEKAWKNPSALSGSQYWTRRPVPTMRSAFAATAIGIDATASATRITTRFSKRYPYMIAKVVSDSNDRMPLQASATSRGMAGRLITLPSRNTGTPKNGSTEADNSDARICNGKVIWLKTMAGIGTISTRNSSGNNTARKNSHPRKNTIMPASNTSNDTRERNSSAPKTPKIKVHSETRIITTPQLEGTARIAASRKRSCHTTNPAKAGTKKPWEKLGSVPHCRTRRNRIGAYSNPASPSRVSSCQPASFPSRYRPASFIETACAICAISWEGEFPKKKNRLNVIYKQFSNRNHSPKEPHDCTYLDSNIST